MSKKNITNDAEMAATKLWITAGHMIGVAIVCVFVIFFPVLAPLVLAGLLIIWLACFGPAVGGPYE